MDGQLVASRSGLIIGLGVIALVILGPITGVPAWLMANQDLRDLRAGLIAPSSRHSLTAGKWLAIFGTILSPLWVIMFGMMAFVFGMVAGTMLLMP